MLRSLQEIEIGCHELGLPFTLQRRAILGVLVDAEDHPTADEVHARLDSTHSRIARATVFRTLETFAEYGLIQRVPHPGSSARYDAIVHRHHHLVCDHCGAIQDLEDARLNRIKLPESTSVGFTVTDYSIHLRGQCMNCARNSEL